MDKIIKPTVSQQIAQRSLTIPKSSDPDDLLEHDLITAKTINTYYLVRRTIYLLFLSPVQFIQGTRTETTLKRGWRFVVYRILLVGTWIKLSYTLISLASRFYNGTENENVVSLATHTYGCVRDIWHAGVIWDADRQMDQFAFFTNSFFHWHNKHKLPTEKSEEKSSKKHADGCHSIRYIILPMCALITLVRFLGPLRNPSNKEMALSIFLTKKSPFWQKLVSGIVEGLVSLFACTMMVICLLRDVMYMKASTKWAQYLRSKVTTWKGERSNPAAETRSLNYKIIMEYRTQEVLNGLFQSTFRSFQVPFLKLILFSICSILGYNTIVQFSSAPLAKFLLFPLVLMLTGSYSRYMMRAAAVLNEASMQLVQEWNCGTSKYMKRVQKSFRTLEIQVGPFYSYQRESELLFYDGVVNMIVTLLCTFNS